MRLSTMQASSNFNPRSPHGERPASYCPCPCQQRFQSTLPARGATMSTRRSAFAESAFQSTLPARGATVVPSSSAVSTTFQSTLPARGATRNAEGFEWGVSYFNPRSPHGERRREHRAGERLCGHFNPRSPHGERRPERAAVGVGGAISIHAPRTGSDSAK